MNRVIRQLFGGDILGDGALIRIDGQTENMRVRLAGYISKSPTAYGPFPYAAPGHGDQFFVIGGESAALGDKWRRPHVRAAELATGKKEHAVIVRPSAGNGKRPHAADTPHRHTRPKFDARFERSNTDVTPNNDATPNPPSQEQ